MDVYSTLLWHLKRSSHLAFLAQELLAIDSQCTEAWIAAGNCFSLQKEHTQALTCFQRAAKVGSVGNAYAWTLSGHEALAMEDVRKAMGMFENALSLDPRHYNAW